MWRFILLFCREHMTRSSMTWVLQKLPVVFAVDRAGLVGSDGETHQGIFDLSFLSSIPNMTVMSPKHKWELADMLRFALKSDGPVAIRYPRGAAYDQYVEYRAPIEYGKSEMICEESGIALISMGHMFEEAVESTEESQRCRVFLHACKRTFCKADR